MTTYKSAPRLDATNIAGITTLMNPQHLKNNVNLQQVENTIMKKDKAPKVKDEFDPVKHYTNEISQLAEELGVDLVTTYDETKKVKEVSRSIPPVIKQISRVDVLELNNSDSDHSVPRSRISKKSKSSSSSDSSKSSKSNRSHISDDRQSKSSKSSRRSVDVDKFISNLDKNIGIDISQEKYKKRYDIPKPRNDYDRRSEYSDHNPNKVVKNVVSEMYNETKTTHGSEREKVQDIKASKIEQISQLRMTLEEEGINCDNIAQPTSDTDLSQIDSILNILRLKNDRNRYSTLAEEIILGMAEGIETVFDGSRKVPIVNWQPDYRGYHSTVNIKLHRMRFETSQVVGSVIEKYEISPTMRIIMELLPSFFLYPRQQSKQKSTPGLHSDPRINDASLAFASIAEMDGRKKTEELSNI